MTGERLNIVMPVFNCAPYLAEAIESVLAQTYRDFDLLIIDDGSKDGSPEIIRQFVQKDSRIRVITTTNRGLAHALNLGLEEAKGEWVALMHGDDVMLPNRLERQLAFIAEHPHLAVVSSLVNFIDSSGRYLGLNRSYLTSTKAVNEAIARNERIAFNHPACILRRDVIISVGGYRQEFWPAEDVDLWNRLVAAGHEVLVQPESLLNYRVHASSASASRARLVVRRLRWIEMCMADRRAGKPEPTWEEFGKRCKAMPLMARIKERRLETARHWYQIAQHLFAARKYLTITRLLLGAVLLEPAFLVRILARLKRTGQS